MMAGSSRVRRSSSSTVEWCRPSRWAMSVPRAAAEGKPYTKTGSNGVYDRRHELPEAFHAIGKHRLAEWMGTLLDREESEVVRAGLRLLEEHERRHQAGLQALRADIAAGKASGAPKPGDEVFAWLEAKYRNQ